MVGGCVLARGERCDASQVPPMPCGGACAAAESRLFCAHAQQNDALKAAVSHAGMQRSRESQRLRD